MLLGIFFTAKCCAFSTRPVHILRLHLLEINRISSTVFASLIWLDAVTVTHLLRHAQRRWSRIWGCQFVELNSQCFHEHQSLMRSYRVIQMTLLCQQSLHCACLWRAIKPKQNCRLKGFTHELEYHRLANYL